MKKLLLCCLVMLVVSGCSQSLLRQGHRAADEGNYDQAIDLYYQEIAANPTSADAWLGLGTAFYKKGDLDKSEDALKQSIAIKPGPSAHLYIGMIQEKRGDSQRAIDAYGTALSLNPSGHTRNVLRAHVDRLLAERIKREVGDALAAEGEINSAEIPQNTIAVADFDAAGLRTDLVPLARGLAEFTAIDLAKVKSLRVVDRLKIDVILDELKLSQSAAIDQASAPRVGRLLGSRRLVTGSLLGLGDESFRLNGAVVNTVDSSVVQAETNEGELKRLFAVQKEFVFRLLKDIGVEITPEERDAIAAVPTESFLAFLSFSRGLEYQHRGQLSEAAAAFNEAAAQDPGFAAAAAKAASVNGSLALGGPDHTFGTFEQTVVGEEPVATLTGRLDNTLMGLSHNLGNLPNFESRRPAEEPPRTQGNTTVTVKGDLNGN